VRHERRPVVYILASPNRARLYWGHDDLGRRLKSIRWALSSHTAPVQHQRVVTIESYDTVRCDRRETQISDGGREEEDELIESVRIRSGSISE